MSRTRQRRQTVIGAERRARVAALLARGLTQREIQHALQTQGHVNPETGRAWSTGVIAKDAAALCAQWRERAAAEIDNWRGELIARLDALYRDAWARADLRSALEAVKQQRAILGADAPARRELTGAAGGPIAFEGRGLSTLLAEAEGGAE